MIAHETKKKKKGPNSNKDVNNYKCIRLYAHCKIKKYLLLLWFHWTAEAVHHNHLSVAIMLQHLKWTSIEQQKLTLLYKIENNKVVMSKEEFVLCMYPKDYWEKSWTIWFQLPSCEAVYITKNSFFHLRLEPSSSWGCICLVKPLRQSWTKLKHFGWGVWFSLCTKSSTV